MVSRANGLIVAIAVITIAIASAAPSAQANEDQALLQFERAVDTYAFQHRQVERRVGGVPGEGAMAAAIRNERVVPGEGVLFTPLAAAAFRNRIDSALGTGRCAAPNTGLSAIVPRPNETAANTVGLSDCLVTALPRLPAELQYRAAGVVLVLVDVQANLVVDVVHGAFHMRND